MSQTARFSIPQRAQPLVSSSVSLPKFTATSPLSSLRRESLLLSRHAVFVRLFPHKQGLSPLYSIINCKLPHPPPSSGASNGRVVRTEEDPHENPLVPEFAGPSRRIESTICRQVDRVSQPHNNRSLTRPRLPWFHCSTKPTHPRRNHTKIIATTTHTQKQFPGWDNWLVLCLFSHASRHLAFSSTFFPVLSSTLAGCYPTSWLRY